MRIGRRVGNCVKKERARKKSHFVLSHSSFSAPLSMLRNDDDEEEAARERRRRARQERLRSRESEEPSSQPDSSVLTNSHR